MYVDAGGDMRTPPLVGKWGVKKTIRCCARRIIAVSHAVLRNVMQANPSATEQVVYNGVPDQFFAVNDTRESLSPATTVGSSDSRLTIGVPGTLRRMKGQDFFLKSMLLAVQGLDDFEIVITGEGPDDYRNELLSIAADARLHGHVRFVGNVADMPKFLESCDIAVVPSSCDPLPRTVMESMAAGVAVIGTDVGGIPEMIDHEQTGLLVEFNNLQQMADSVLRLAHDLDLRSRLGVAARASAQQKFPLQRCQDTLLTAIEELCPQQV
jgi:glycosyltransferase involved in cell wall biosynthesis